MWIFINVGGQAKGPGLLKVLAPGPRGASWRGGKKRNAHHSRKIRVASQYQERPCKLAWGERKGKHITVGKYALLRNIKKDPKSMIEKILQLVKKSFLSFMIDRVISKY